MFFNPIWAIKY